MPTESRMVAIGRSMNGKEKFSASLRSPCGTDGSRSTKNMEAILDQIPVK
jgi:hypothetical protein